MEPKLCVFEEQGRDGCDRDGSIFEITDFVPAADMFFLAELYWEFCRLVLDEDVSPLQTFVEGDQSFTVTQAEARIYGYIHAGYKIKVAYQGNVMAGFLIYLPIFANLYAVKSLYIEPWANGSKLGKRLVSSLQEKTFKFLFKTLKANPPSACLEKSKATRIKITEDDNSYTWIIEWRTNGLY